MIIVVEKSQAVVLVEVVMVMAAAAPTDFNNCDHVFWHDNQQANNCH